MLEKPQPIDWYPSGSDGQQKPMFEPGEGVAEVIYPGKDRIRFDDEGYKHGADSLGGDQIRPR